MNVVAGIATALAVILLALWLALRWTHPDVSQWDETREFEALRDALRPRPHGRI